MFSSVSECLAGGGAYSAYVRVEFVGGAAITKPALIAEKDCTDRLIVSKYILLTADELRSRQITRVGVTDSEGGAELVGGVATSAGGSGELERTLTFTLALKRPEGWTGNEKLFDMLSGTVPFSANFELASDGGERTHVEPVFAENKILFSARFSDGLGGLTLFADGETALTFLPERETRTEELPRARDGEYYCAAESTRLLKSVTSGGQAVLSEGINVPILLGAEMRLPLKFGGKMTAFGDYLLLTEADSIRIFGERFSLLASRSGRGITDCSITKSGTFALADSERIRICKGSKDICELPDGATSVVLTENNGNFRLHYLSGGRLIGADISGGNATQVYSIATDSVSIVQRGNCIFGVSLGYTGYARLYTDGGEQLSQHVITEGVKLSVVGKSSGLFLLKTSTRCWLVNPYIQFGALGDCKAFCSRAYLTESGGKTQLMNIGKDSDEVVCELTADDMAYSDRLYYRRGDALFCRDPIHAETRIIADDAANGITAVYDADRYAAAGSNITASITLA